jgi:hypothetical protein
VPAQHGQGQPEQDVASDDNGREPDRDDVAQAQADERGKDIEAVGRRVEQHAEPARLIQLSREDAVSPVREAGHGEQDQCRDVGVRPEEQPQEDGHAHQPQYAQRVRHGPHAVTGDLARCTRRHAASLLDALSGPRRN